jgi:hypothetical protein
MAVVNIPPDDMFYGFPAGSAPGLVHIYNTGNPPARSTMYVFEIAGNPIPRSISPGHTDTFPVNGQAWGIANDGPSRLQVLYGNVVEATEAGGMATSRDAR